MIFRFSSIAITALALTIGSSVFASLETPTASAQDKEKKKEKEKNPLEGKKGVFVGTLTAKEKNAIEVQAPGDEKARRFVPHWRGGAPAQGGGPDKEMLKTFSELKIGSRIEVTWVFEERFRAEKIVVLKTPVKDKDK